MDAKTNDPLNDPTKAPAALRSLLGRTNRDWWPNQLSLDILQQNGLSGDPISFVQHLRLLPLPGRDARPVLVQMARADRTMPNPATSLMIKAGGLLDSTWIYRHDLARRTSFHAGWRQLSGYRVQARGRRHRLLGRSELGFQLDAKRGSGNDHCSRLR